MENREKFILDKDTTWVKSEKYSDLSLHYLDPCEYKEELLPLTYQKVKKMRPKHPKIENRMSILTLLLPI